MKKQKNENKEIEKKVIDADLLMQAVAVPEPQNSIFDIVSISQDGIRRIDNNLTGILKGFNDSGTPLVDFHRNPGGKAIEACSTVHLKPAHIGRKVVLAFDDGNPLCPIVLGIIKQEKKSKLPLLDPTDHATSQDVEVDGERIIIDAEKEIVLRCGESSITLTKSGKVLIRGKYVLSSSTGMNEIKGGGVRVN
ncbi:MAG: DUF6484 domain-containing protein [Smithella sp.]